MANFGWSLCDSFNPRRTGLANFRSNLILKSMDDTDEKKTFTSVAHYPASDHNSSSFDSCIGSDYPSPSSSSDSDVPCALNAPKSKRLRTKSAPLTLTSPLSPLSSSTSTGGTLQHAMAVMENREQEMTNLFSQLHEISADLDQMTDQVGVVTRNLQRSRRRSRRSSAISNRRQSRQLLSSISSSSSNGGGHQLGTGPMYGSCASFPACGAFASGGASAFTEDEMADIVHRLLTQICERQMARCEGRHDIPLII